MESIYGKVPLDRDCRNIRLIKLLRNGPDAPISCRFCTTKLSSPKLYKAVSYTWGDPASTRSILLDGETFAIRENLWNFLNQERQVQHPSYLWIDAICIDQTNDIERGYQVALMREIYSKAFKVTVWLGPSTEDTRSHLLHLQYLSKFSKTIELHSWEPDFTDFVLELCRRPYWHRVWIVQEFVLATEIDICCGYQKIEGRALGWLFKVLRKEARGDWGSRVLVRELWQTPAMQILQQRAGWYEWSNETRGFSFTTLLNTFGRLQCSDPRDRIYGLLSLADPTELEALDVVPDYSKPAVQLFEEVIGKLRRHAVHMDEFMLTEYASLLRDLLELDPDREVIKETATRSTTTQEEQELEEVIEVLATEN